MSGSNELARGLDRRRLLSERVLSVELGHLGHLTGWRTQHADILSQILVVAGHSKGVVVQCRSKTIHDWEESWFRIISIDSGNLSRHRYFCAAIRLTLDCLVELGYELWIGRVGNHLKANVRLRLALRVRLQRFFNGSDERLQLLMDGIQSHQDEFVVHALSLLNFIRRLRNLKVRLDALN